MDRGEWACEQKRRSKQVSDRRFQIAVFSSKRAVFAIFGNRLFFAIFGDFSDISF